MPWISDPNLSSETTSQPTGSSSPSNLQWTSPIPPRGWGGRCFPCLSNPAFNPQFYHHFLLEAAPEGRLPVYICALIKGI